MISAARQQDEYFGSSRPHFKVLEGGVASAASRVGPYELHEEIGQGGMASVYRAWHTGLHRFEALKLPRRGADGADTEYIQRLLSEARTAARLHHPHIVGIHNISEDGAPQPYFAMDLIEGQSLAQLLQERGALPLQDALTILRQTAGAVAHAHRNGVVHRDLKPENILLQAADAGEWNAKVVDFGISRAAEDGQGTRLTRSGILVGTPEYMSPEQAGSGQPVDYRTDIYSLGVVAYEMLTGAPPFEAGDGVSRMAVLIAQVNSAPRPPLEVNPQLSPAVNDAILKALAKNPDERFPSAEEFRNALEAAAAPREAAEVMPAALPSLRRRGWAALGTAVLLGVLAGYLVAAMMRRPSATAAQSAIQTQLRAQESLAQATLVARAALAAKPQLPPLVKHRQVVQRTVAFKRETRNTAYLPRGQRKVVRKGQNGLREVVLEITMRGEREMARRAVGSRVLKPSLTQVELLGTRVPKKAPVRQTSVPQSSSRKVPPRKVAPRQAPPHKAPHKAPPRKAPAAKRASTVKSYLSRIEAVRPHAPHRKSPKKPNRGKPGRHNFGKTVGRVKELKSGFRF